MHFVWDILTVFTFSEQVGQQNLPFGLKFDAKGIVDCYEKELEILPSGMKREIEFKMTEGDFQLFEGKWSILQVGFCCYHAEIYWILQNFSYMCICKSFKALYYFDLLIF